MIESILHINFKPSQAYNIIQWLFFFFRAYAASLQIISLYEVFPLLVVQISLPHYFAYTYLKYTIGKKYQYYCTTLLF